MDKIKHLESKYSLARYELITQSESSELHLYLYLKLYAINKHEAFPSFRTIQRDLHWSMDKINGTIKRMKASGRLKISREAGRNNLYDITWYDKANDGVLRKSEHHRSENQSTNAPTSRAELLINKTIRNKTINAKASELDSDKKLERKKIPTNDLLRTFDRYCQTIRGVRPIFVRFKDGNLIKHALRHLNEFQVDMLFVWFLKEKVKMQPTIGAALCKEVISDFITTSHREYGFYSRLDQLWRQYNPDTRQFVKKEDADAMVEALAKLKAQLLSKLNPFGHGEQSKIAEEVAAEERALRR